MQKSTRKQNKVLLDSMRKPQPSLRVREAIQSLTTGLFSFAINSRYKDHFVRCMVASLALLMLLSTIVTPATGSIWGRATDEHDIEDKEKAGKELPAAI